MNYRDENPSDSPEERQINALTRERDELLTQNKRLHELVKEQQRVAAEDQPPAPSPQPLETTDPRVNQGITNLANRANTLREERDGWKQTCNSLRGLLDMAGIRTQPGGTIVEAAYYVGTDRIEWLPIDEWKRRRRQAAIDSAILRSMVTENAFAMACELDAYRTLAGRDLRAQVEDRLGRAAETSAPKPSDDAQGKPPDWPKFLVGFDERGDRTIFVYVSPYDGRFFDRNGNTDKAVHTYDHNASRSDVRVVDAAEARTVAAAFETKDPAVATARWIRTYLEDKGMPLALDVTFAPPAAGDITVGSVPLEFSSFDNAILRCPAPPPPGDLVLHVHVPGAGNSPAIEPMQHTRLVLGDIATERHRQITELGHTPESDYNYRSTGDLANRAAVRALSHIPILDRKDTKPADALGEYRRALVQAGALLVAEIERLDRHQGTQKGYRDLEKGPMQ